MWDDENSWNEMKIRYITIVINGTIKTDTFNCISFTVPQGIQSFDKIRANMVIEIYHLDLAWWRVDVVVLSVVKWCPGLYYWY